MKTETSAQLTPVPEIMRCLLKHQADGEFNDFMSFLKNRAIVLLLFAANTKDQVEERWLQGRAKELMDLTTIFEERAKLRKEAAAAAAGRDVRDNLP